MSKRKEVALLVSLIVLLFVINYPFLDSALVKFLDEKDFVIVERVIDGDTVVVNGSSLRLLGINTPERGEEYYKEAKDYLENLVLNKTVYLKYGKDKFDRYGRTLAYIFLGNENINMKIVENGFGNFYFPSGKDQYYKDFFWAWEDCIASQKGLCEKSIDICSSCIDLVKINMKKQESIFANVCNFDCDLTNWKIKDEGRKNFIFPEFVLERQTKVKVEIGEDKDTKNILFWSGEDYVWTKTGDTLFLRDSVGKLVIWESY
jgi:micrococcal nuclease